MADPAASLVTEALLHRSLRSIAEDMLEADTMLHERIDVLYAKVQSLLAYIASLERRIAQLEAMGLLWLLHGTAQLRIMRRFLQAWLYAHRLALEARTAPHIAPRRPRRFDIFRYRYLLFTFKFWWRYCLRLRLAMHGIDLATLGEPEREASPCSQPSAPHGTTWVSLVFDGRIWFRLAQSMNYASLRALRCLSKAHAWRVRMAQTRTATHIIDGRLALVWEFYSEIFIQLAPPLQRVLRFSSAAHCIGRAPRAAYALHRLLLRSPLDFSIIDVSKAPRDQRVTALRGLGAEKMVQLEGEEPIPAPPKDPPTPHGMARRTANAKPRVAWLIQLRTAKKLEDQQIQSPHRQEARGSDDPAPHRQKPGHWTNKQGKGKGRPWADISDADEWDDIPASDAAPSSAPPAQGPAPHPAPRPAQQPAQHPAQQPGNLDVGWAAFYAYEKGLAKGKAQQAQHWAPPSPFPGATPQGWAYPPPAPPRDPSPHRPATLRASRHVHSEVRWIKDSLASLGAGGSHCLAQL
ncbi:hypothetical protein AK812_SmicGene45304 [Symbiodinium microadriaticum]|uniref:Uncharacterized protein n=1 Tax=Symbiodinium microadriaticum TaxID=2951 RepID=A0A1Q9BWE8_SYMMI|nr:hypothetical protein AK812_SmicGene45304 [Symbiodinium microadriaticum]